MAYDGNKYGFPSDGGGRPTPKPKPAEKTNFIKDDGLAIIFALIAIFYLLWVLEGLALGCR